ncbi:hypothetical protein [Dapis sp. BLCC M172]|uniref:hypothetical protein n=1 Tax=Dapis sp. BLCC M172 TaxID=2975281 RepID=UPI003CFA68A9
MANLNITDLTPEFMAEAITNAKAPCHNSMYETSDGQAGEVVCCFDTIGHLHCRCSCCPPTIVMVYQL